MSAKNAATVGVRIEDNYIEGYDPVSLHAPHSSLLKVSTWLGMGSILSVIPCMGIFIFGFGAHSVRSQVHANVFILIGIIATILVLSTGVALVHYGRRDYRSYRARTGRIN